MRFNPEHLITFALVVREGGVNNAAKRLHLTQPAVSNQLRKLQERIGQPLYQRSGRKIALTDTGKKLYVHAREMIATLEDVQALVDKLNAGESGMVRIRASQTAGAYVLPSLLAGFRRQAPGIDIDLGSYNSGEVLARLEYADLAFIEAQPSSFLPPSWEAEAIARDEIVAVIRHDHALAALPTVTFAQLSAETLIWREEGSALRDQVEEAFRAAGIEVDTGIRLAGVAAIKEAVRQGLGIGFASQMALRHDRGPLRGISLDPSLRRQIYMLSPRNPGSASRRLIDYIRRQAASMT